VKPEAVVIFGATSAIAVGFARALAPRGARFHLVARDAAKLGAVRDDLLARGAKSVTSAVADLDLVDEHARLVSEAAASLGAIDAALLAQGTLPDQARCETDLVYARAQILNNFVAPASLAAELANFLVRQDRGALAVIGSVAGDRGRASNYVYGSAKGGLAEFLAGLRARLRKTNVSVITVKPGFVETPMTAHLKKGALWASPEAVGSGILRAIESGRGEVYLPGFWRLIMFVIRHIPEPIFVRMKL
jgi:decaprenylphospho-beta-D-erythro-pentofuranosid-2-ulose 2-reductase